MIKRETKTTTGTAKDNNGIAFDYVLTTTDEGVNGRVYNVITEYKALGMTADTLFALKRVVTTKRNNWNIG